MLDYLSALFVQNDLALTASLCGAVGVTCFLASYLGNWIYGAPLLPLLLVGALAGVERGYTAGFIYGREQDEMIVVCSLVGIQFTLAVLLVLTLVTFRLNTGYSRRFRELMQRNRLNA